LVLLNDFLQQNYTDDTKRLLDYYNLTISNVSGDVDLVFEVFQKLLVKINKTIDYPDHVINNYNKITKFAMILLAIRISLRVKAKFDTRQHVTIIPDQWKNEANDLINLIEESQLCFSEITYRMPEGNLEVKRTYRCTNVKKNHSPDGIELPHYCNKQLFTPDTSWAIITKWFTTLWAYFGMGYYPRWQGTFQQHANVITENVLRLKFEKAICKVFEKSSQAECLTYAAMLLKSLTNGVLIEISKTVVENRKMKVNFYCPICFTAGEKLCKRCSLLWNNTEKKESWTLKSLYD